jgi:SagB-type dehydrogenase family enzyme
MNSGFMNWGTQPSTFKYYPHFYPRFKLDSSKEFDSQILLSGKVTFEKKYGQDSFYLRVQPSAGALYPTELYAQIRNSAGWLDGIYHFEPLEQNLTLLYELNGDGLESVAGLDYSIDGVLFLISSPYFRSSWKYKNRALRYSLLDSGHVYGALEFSAFLHNSACESVFDFDQLLVSEFFGFENKELPILMAFCGKKQDIKLKKPQITVPFVNPTDYFEQNIVVESGFKQNLQTIKPTKKYQEPRFHINKTTLQNTILNRRSIRAFYKQPITKDEFEQIMQIANEPVKSAHDETLDIFYVVNNIDGVEKGVYKNGAIIKSGNFSKIAGYLCLEQALGMESAVTFFVTANAKSYQTAMILAGIFGHRLYIASNLQGIGASGIGAYYDDEVKEFLNCSNDILYAVAIGR